MLIRLFLSLSLLGAWSLPAFACLRDPLLHPIKRTFLTEEMLREIDFDKATQQVSGGGTWYDSKGREGTFSSQLSTLRKNGVGCPNDGTLHGCASRTELHRYSIELDDGRSEWVRWGKLKFFSGMLDGAEYFKSVSEEASVDVTFVRRADEGDSRTITIAYGDYTLVLVEEKIKGVPNLVYTPIPTSNLSPQDLKYKLLRRYSY